MKLKYGMDVVESIQDVFLDADKNSPEIVDKILTQLLHKIKR